MHSIDLNCDIGEGIGPDSGNGMDAALMQYVSSVNIACGFHAGNPDIMDYTVQKAIDHQVRIGAHPGLPDKEGFGRHPMPITAREAYQITLYQIGSLYAFTKAHDVRLHHVKPHGALYNMAAADRILAEAIVQAIIDFDPFLILYGLADSELIKAGKTAGLRVANEVFADRTYQKDGSLTPRSQPGSGIIEKQFMLEQVKDMVFQNKVTAVNGAHIPISAETICIHGDGPNALEFAKAIYEYLIDHQVTIQALNP